MTGKAVVSPELKAAMKSLRLGQQLPTIADRIALARKQKLDVEDFLLMLFSDEVARRKSHSTLRRAQKAGLDPEMVLERWDETSEVHYDKRVLQQLTTLRFIEGLHVGFMWSSSGTMGRVSARAAGIAADAIVSNRPIKDLKQFRKLLEDLIPKYPLRFNGLQAVAIFRNAIYPNDTNLIGLDFGIQGVGLRLPAANRGNFMNLHRDRVRN